MKEKRLEPRICTAFTAKCTDLSEEKNSFYTAIRDISPKGAQLLCDKALPCGAYYNININMIYDTAQARAQVAWNDKKSNSDEYYVGLRFLETQDNNLRKIEDFLDAIFLETLHCSCGTQEYYRRTHRA